MRYVSYKGLYVVLSFVGTCVPLALFFSFCSFFFFSAFSFWAAMPCFFFYSMEGQGERVDGRGGSRRIKSSRSRETLFPFTGRDS